MQAEGLRFCDFEFNLVLHLLCDFGVMGMPRSEDMPFLSGVGGIFPYVPFMNGKIQKIE